MKMASTLLYGGDEHADLYSKFRPTYAEDIYKSIYDFCEKNQRIPFDYDLAVDVGCGNGQSTLPLCKKFRKVIGCDISPAQIKYSRSGFEHLPYEVSPGENMAFLEDRSVDLVTVSAALHWLDREAFYDEVARVLKPGGVMAAYGYDLPRVEKDEADCVLRDFYTAIYPYWADGGDSCSQMYGDIAIPFTDQQMLCDIYGNKDMELEFTMFMLLGRKPILAGTTKDE